MSTQVYIGHSGQRLSLDPNVVNTLEALRSWITEQAGIQPRAQILLTSQGKQVRTQTLLTEKELFVFDSGRLSNPKAAASPSSSGLSGSNDFTPGPPPDVSGDSNELETWQNLFRLRKSWASGLLSGCDERARLADRYQDEFAVIQRSVGVAVASLQQHVQTAEQRYASSEEWAEEQLQEQHNHVANWEQHLDSLRSIPARSEFTRFIQPPSSGSRRMSQQANLATLQGFVDVASTRKAASDAKQLMDSFADQVNGLRNELEAVTRDSEDLLNAVDQISGRSAHSSSESAQLMEEIQLVANKMASDSEHVRSLPAVQQSLAQVQKMAQLHQRNYLPALKEHCDEMNELVNRTRQERDSAAAVAQEHMQTLSGIESQLSQLYSDLKTLDIPQDELQSFDTLNIVSRLPSVYGQLLVESVRRREWVAKMKRDSATLQEEVATYQEEEDKRRKKWIRSVEDVVNPSNLRSNVLGIELSLQNEGGSWPMVTRDELDEYLKVLTEVYGQGPVTEELDQAVHDLDKPTRKQIKHAKAFKNGSMHEAAFGDTSLLLRGDEQTKSLRESNLRLEEELRGSKSRVRKLEDLLHRQSQFSRASTGGDLFTPQSATFSERAHTPNLPSQAPSEDPSRSNSMRHRRLSSAQAIEEKKLARRVVDLETELQAHKDEAANRKNSDAENAKQVEDAISTKRDLMENMEAQQREFANERRTLERELSEAKERIEEVENEMDRLMGSRDNERDNVDARTAAFEEEIARLKEDAMGHAARAATAQDARAALERKLEAAQSERNEAIGELQSIKVQREEREEAENEQLQLLATAHNHLEPNGNAPEDLASFASLLEELARRSAAHSKDLEEAVAFAKSENESLSANNERQRVELTTAAEKHGELEESIRKAEEAHAVEQAKMQSLQLQLSDEQQQLKDLRSKFAEGETGSEVLRQRIADEEAKSGKLSWELAEANSHINSMDVELMRLQKKHKAYHTSAEASSERLQKRADRAKEVSQRLYSEQTRLVRCLERLGLAITYDGDTMVIDRASKMGASTNMSDMRGHMDRTISLTSPPPTRKSSTTEEALSQSQDLSFIHWSDAQSAEEETAQYEAFLQHVARFDVDAFTDGVHKRLRDYEYTAKKYNKEGREANRRAEGYKEKAGKLKAEAHAKIAVKDFKEGDLALFLPTRGQAKGAWAAFNIGCPHYFLAEKEGMRLGSRDFIVARISKVEQRVVDLSKPQPSNTDGRSVGEGNEAPSIEDDNPFDLSDGLTWWMVHAVEERGPGAAPTTPGLGKSTVAAANVDARGSIRIKRSSKGDDASKHLNKSLDSRRSSSTSKKGATLATGVAGSPTLSQHTPDPQVSRQRSDSQASLRPPPAQISSSSAPTSGLGVVANANDDGPQSEQVRKVSLTEQPGLMLRSRSPLATTQPQQQQQQRTKSPSKSVRSLQRHLEQAPPRSYQVTCKVSG
ncbi:hypothetical protein D0867_01818 [Hortaea werneckii]|uniref:Autophagy-related protein 11 n=2 Tax=Hortaea werneckii TaxID=91943 RepID=A0A3M7A8T4_HORWE|nr:hypothetical protein D0867_01818 [Hortaea werneckii]